MIFEEDALYKKLADTKINEGEFSVMPSKEGGFTVLYQDGRSKAYIHSKYNPVKTGEQFAKSVYVKKDMAVYGLGLGYHIKPLYEMLEMGQRLYIFESSMETTKMAFEKTDILTVLKSDNVFFLCSDNISLLAKYMDDVINGLKCEFVIYEPSLKTIPKKMEKLYDVLIDYKSALHMYSQHKGMMEKNKQKNIKAGFRNGVKLLSKSFTGIPAIVVAAGASLEYNAAQILKVRNKALVVSVTRAAKTLEEYGVTPDFYVATDAGGWLTYHLNFKTMSRPLFLLSTADSNHDGYKGEKLIMYEKNSVPDDDNEFYVEAGGSVATAAISLCASFGANPIVLIGQDLCYCFDKSHSGVGVATNIQLKGGKYVKANDGNEYYTTGSLYIFLKWIERYIAKNNNIKFFNATYKGALIEGAKNVELLSFFENFEDVRDKIDGVKNEKNL